MEGLLYHSHTVASHRNLYERLFVFRVLRQYLRLDGSGVTLLLEHANILAVCQFESEYIRHFD
jgi:hypothetical protein